jgi:hypothetical protein
MRVPFSEVFEINENAVTPKHVVNIGGIQMSPGISFEGGVSFSNFNLAEHFGKDLEIEKDKTTGILTISKIYN